jgi:hypothetical protein
MSDHVPAPDATPPATPQTGWTEGGRVELLADWIAAQRGAFTESALERSAVAAGYTSDEFAQAVAVTEMRSALGPIRSTARRAVLAAYGIVWAVFALVFLGQPTAYGLGSILQLVLTIALGVGLAISLFVMRHGRPDPERRARALALLLAVPVVLLVGVAGLCLPFTSSTS